MKSTLSLILALFFIATFHAVAGDVVPASTAGDDGVAITYQLSASGLVTLVIDDARGARVRNLVAGARRDAGRQVERWDGLDDTGRPVPAGEYHWRGLVHGPITSHFLGAFNSPGNPPWQTYQIPAGWNIRASGAGGWLSDHERPLCAYSDGNRIFIGARIAEAGHSIIELNPDGHKTWGTLWLSLSGANAIATDGDILYVAGEKGWLKDSLAVNRLSLKTHGWIGNPPEIQKQRTDACFIKEKSADFSGIRGMVVTPQYLVLSLADSGRLAFFDRARATHVKDMPLPGAGMILKLPDGSVLGISGTAVVRIDLDSGKLQPVVTDHLAEPSGLAVDSRGRIYVSDMAPTEQCIKVFSPDGKWLARIGKPGGRHEGHFDPLVMSRPTALAIDDRDQIWVAENEFLPKRVSVWSSDGKLVRDYIGPPHYGGAGALDPKTPGRAYYEGMQFAWKPWPDSAALETVLYRPDEHPDLPYPTDDNTIPTYPVYVENTLYLMHDENYALPGVFIGEVVGDHLRPRVIFGSLRTLWNAWRDKHPEFVKKFVPGDKPPTTGVFLWQDLNGDGRADPSEVTVQPDWQFGAMWSMRSWPTLNLYARRDHQLVILSPKADSRGSQQTASLRYDLTDARYVPLPEIAQKNGVCATSPDSEGNVLVNCGGGNTQGSTSNVFLSLALDGSTRWTYPNPYPANWHNSPRPVIGNIQHTLNIEGIVSLGEKTGRIFQLNGNKGLRYLFTTDGLFIAQLYGDMRIAPLQQNLTKATPGMRLDENSLGDECFSGWLGQAPDGRILQIVGKDSCNVAEVRGLESLTRLPGGPVMLKQQSQAKEQSSEGGRKPIQAIFAGGFGYTPGWEKLCEYKLPPKDPVARFAVGCTDRGLHLWLDVQDETPFENNGQDINTLFHTGDAVDFRLSANPDMAVSRPKPQVGDNRFLISMYKGKPVVVRYSYVVPGGDTAPAKFASPTGMEQVDRITVLKAAQVNVKRQVKGYEISVDISWAELGLEKRPTGALLGDVGIIFGDPTSNRAVMRAYYFDQESQVISDIPSEVRVSPARWGKILF